MAPSTPGDRERRGTDRRTYLRAAGAMGLAGFAGYLDGSGGIASTDTITLGGSMSLSGDDAGLGELYRDAYELTVGRINEAGGVEAGDGATYELELVLRDDGSDAGESVAIYRDLVDRGIEYLVGPYSSEITLEASAVAADARQPMVTGGGASPEIFDRGNEWIVGLLPTADTYAGSSVEMAMAQSEPPSSAALLVEDDTFSQTSAAGAREALQSAGVDVVVDQTFPGGTSDLSDLLGYVQDSDADVLVLFAHGKHAVLAAEGLADQRIDVDMAMATVGTLTDSFEDRTGTAGNYWYGPSPWAETADYSDVVFGSTDEFVSAIEREYGYEPGYHSAVASAVVQTFQRAFESAEELAPEPVRDAVRESQFDSLYGPVEFGDDGVIQRDMVVYQWQPGAGRQLVWPEEDRQTEPIYPMPAWDER